MPGLRVLTWNSTGESNERGDHLVNFIRDTESEYPDSPVKLIVIQEATKTGARSIGEKLDETQVDEDFEDFVSGHGTCSEHESRSIQPNPVPGSQMYRLSWKNAGLGDMVSLPSGTSKDPELIKLASSDLMGSAKDAGVDTYVNSLAPEEYVRSPPPDDNKKRRRSSRESKRVDAWRQPYDRTSRNMRWPIHKEFQYAGRTVHLISWHAPRRDNWLEADPVGDGVPFALLSLQQSTYFTDTIKKNLKPGDLIVIAGDLNLTKDEIQNLNIFPEFVKFADGLDHIMAFSPGGTVTIKDDYKDDSTPQTRGDHPIVTANITW